MNLTAFRSSSILNHIVRLVAIGLDPEIRCILNVVLDVGSKLQIQSSFCIIIHNLRNLYKIITNIRDSGMKSRYRFFRWITVEDDNDDDDDGSGSSWTPSTSPFDQTFSSGWTSATTTAAISSKAKNIQIDDIDDIVPAQPTNTQKAHLRLLRLVIPIQPRWAQISRFGRCLGKHLVFDCVCISIVRANYRHIGCKHTIRVLQEKKI